MINAIVDTNVFISGIISPHSFPRKIYQAWKNNKFTLITTLPIKNEIKEVLNRPKISKKYHLSNERINNILLALDLYSRETEDKDIAEISFSDPKDVKFLAAAANSQTDYLVTGDKALLELAEYKAAKIVNPREFMEILREK